MTDERHLPNKLGTRSSPHKNHITNSLSNSALDRLTYLHTQSASFLSVTPLLVHQRLSPYESEFQRQKNANDTGFIERDSGRQQQLFA